MSHTPGPWEWWTSCSWKRLTHNREGDVLCPHVASDGHPILDVSEHDMALIAQAPNLLKVLEKIVFDWDGEPEDMFEAKEVIAKAKP